MSESKTGRSDTGPNEAGARPSPTAGSGPTGDKANPENRQDRAGERLDEALEETFPSSDPVSVKVTK